MINSRSHCSLADVLQSVAIAHASARTLEQRSNSVLVGSQSQMVLCEIPLAYIWTIWTGHLCPELATARSKIEVAPGSVKPVAVYGNENIKMSLVLVEAPLENDFVPANHEYFLLEIVLWALEFVDRGRKLALAHCDHLLPYIREPFVLYAQREA